MDKKKVPIILMTLFVFAFLTFFSIQFLQHPPSMTGFAIYSSQPNSTDGIDTYIRESSDSNYGSITNLRVGKTLAGVKFNSLLKFDLSSIPPTDTIINATLQLYVDSSDGIDNRTIGVYRVKMYDSNDWVESEVTWANKSSTNLWLTVGGDYAAEAIDSLVIENATGNYYNFTITDLISDWLDGTYDNYGIILRAPSAQNGQYTSFASSDHGTEAYRPSLVIEHSTNAIPTISEYNQSTNSTNLLQPGENVTFTATWTDLEGSNTRMFVCNTSNINISQCAGGEFCNTSLSSTNPHQCSYTITENDNRTNTYYLAVCDYGNCSVISNGTFYMNHLPIVQVIQPNGGESINQTASQENYLIIFNKTDADSDELSANLYYGETQGSTNNLIVTDLNLSSTTNCNGPNCQYSWNTTGVYGTYYLTIIANDSQHLSNDSSDNSFNVLSIVDDEPPSITSPTIDSSIYSGKTTTINATISDNNTITAWVDLNYTSTNVSMHNITTTLFTGNFTAPSVGTYAYRVHAQDPVRNLNDSMSWQEFTVSKPSATTRNETAPSTALPYHTIKVTGEIYATNPLTNISAYLNVPSGFTFLEYYPQQITLGDITTGSAGTATWFLSTPITEDTYTLNITYTDAYSNEWNSSNMQVTTTSAIGGYEISIAGYPEVETSEDYYTEAFFKQSGAYTNPDSITISIYDAAGSLTVGPATMTQKSTGIYNYSYTVGASVTEGQWQTLVNATKSSTSYFAYEFWKVVGGPFDVRDITIIDSVINDLNISFVAENTGGANKDLIMTWNLSREDTGAALDSGGETFMVNANSNKTWHITPSTTYVGQVRITIIGYYSGTEKVGAYEVFSTTSGGVSCGDGTCNGAETCSTCSTDCGACSSSSSSTSGGGGGGGGGGATTVITQEEYALTLQEFETEIYLTKNIEKITYLTINNTGNKELTNISLEIENFGGEYYKTTPSVIKSLKPGKTNEFGIELIITDFIGEKESHYKVKTNELIVKEPIKIIVLGMRDFFLMEIKKISEKINELKEKLEGQKDLLEELSVCEDITEGANTSIEKEEFINVKNDLKNAEDCITKVESKIKEKPEKKMIEYWIWIITWLLIIILIAVLIFIGYAIYKKTSVLNFLNTERAKTKTATATPTLSSRQIVDKRLKEIEEKLKE